MTVWWIKVFTVLSLLSVAEISNAQKIYSEFSGNIAGDYRFFFDEGLYDGQRQGFPGFTTTPELFLEWQDGDQSLNVTAFARYNYRDESRSHVDIRELYWQKVKNDWELSIGLKKVYWGVTEAVHLVDIINQTDLLETFDGEAKLGQPMVHFSTITKVGILDLFYLPYFRKRSFPGINSRLRTSFIIETNDIGFESSKEETRPGFAARWSNSIGVVDIGVSHFYGTGREPLFLIDPTNPTSFNIFYPIINQTGLDVQATTGSFLWKFESIIRKTDAQDMFALDVGAEYTFGNIGGKGLDIGLIVEYLYDDRGRIALNSLQNDLFIGSRLAFNDTQSTEFLLGGIIDLDYSSKLLSIEGSRRIGDSWKFIAEVRLFRDVSNQEFVSFFRNDSFGQVSLTRYF